MTEYPTEKSSAPPRPEQPAATRRALVRGLKKLCPHCGEGALFESWAVSRRHCTRCGLRFQRNAGDSWAFLLFIDRAAVVFPVIVALYFGLHRQSLVLFVAVAALLLVGFVLTTPNRSGLCIALDYLARVAWGDGADETHERAPE